MSYTKASEGPTGTRKFLRRYLMTLLTCSITLTPLAGCGVEAEQVESNEQAQTQAIGLFFGPPGWAVAGAITVVTVVGALVIYQYNSPSSKPEVNRISQDGLSDEEIEASAQRAANEARADAAENGTTPCKELEKQRQNAEKALANVARGLGVDQSGILKARMGLLRVMERARQILKCN